MKMVFWVIFSVANVLVFAASGQLASNLTITNLQGRVYRNITLDHTNVLGVVWKAADGSMGEFKYTDLSMACWDQLNLAGNAKNVQKAAAIKKEQEEEIRVAQEEVARQQAEVAREQAETAAKLNQQIENKLSAANVEEQQVDKMTDTLTNTSPEQIAARDALLKALLDISSSTTVGVNRNDYGRLLAKAISALEFGKIKLPADQHGKFLICAEKAIRFYSKANDDWADYFKYDWERDQDETLMSVDDFYDLRQNGLLVSTSSFQKNNDGFFYVPFKESLNLYWQAADIYVHKMQGGAQQ